MEYLCEILTKNQKRIPKHKKNYSKMCELKVNKNVFLAL